MAKSVVYNSDCLEAMRAMPDKAFDLAIVDPPYRDSNQPTRDMRSNGSMASLEGRPDREYFAELRRVSRNQIIWGANNFELPQFKGFVIWQKEIPIDFTMSMVEMASLSEELSTVSKIVKIPVRGQERIHPTQKPVALYKWLLQTYAKPGDTILDTHLGSGSSRIAAYDLDFDFTGYELDKDYFEAQEQRFANHIAQPKLWEPASVPVKQNAMFAEAA